MRFYWERVEASRNFANKVWNASRFIMMNLPEEDISLDDMPELTDADKWVISKVNDVVKEVTYNLENYELGIAADKIYNFVWEEFCDWYIEMVKPRLYNDEDTSKKAALWTLKKVLITALKLLHPYMPFVTEEIYCTLMDDEDNSIMVSEWPVYKDEYHFGNEEKVVERIKEAVKGIRNIRAEMNVPPSRKSALYVVSENAEVRSIFEESKVFFATLGYASEVKIQADKSGIADDAVSILIHEAAIYIPFAELVDIDKEIERLTKEKEKLSKELERSEKMLSNEKFVSKAPQAKIDEEKAKQKKYQDMMEQVVQRLGQLTK